MRAGGMSSRLHLYYSPVGSVADMISTSHFGPCTSQTIVMHCPFTESNIVRLTKMMACFSWECIMLTINITGFEISWEIWLN